MKHLYLPLALLAILSLHSSFADNENISGLETTTAAAAAAATVAPATAAATTTLPTTDDITEAIQANEVESLKQQEEKYRANAQTVGGQWKANRALPAVSVVFPRPTVYHVRHFNVPAYQNVVRSGFVYQSPRPETKPAECPQQDKRHLAASTEQHNLERFYLNPKSSDIMFSVCGNILPAHRLLLETGGKSFYQRFEASESGSPIQLDDIEIMLGGQVGTDPNTTTSTKAEPACPNDALLEAFRFFLKYFYQPKAELQEISNVETIYHLWRLSDKYFATRPAVKVDIEQRLVEMINRATLVSIYQFTRSHGIDSVKTRWLDYVNAHTEEVFDQQQGQLKMSCEDEIKADVEMLDHLLSSLASNQTAVITILGNLIQQCPQLPPIANITAGGTNLFPNSLHYYHCSVEDLNELRKMNFISIDNFADSVVDRLKAKEREYQQLLREKAAAAAAAAAAASKQVPVYVRPPEGFMGGRRQLPRRS